jgi:serine O-acetyltransferase
MFDSIREDWAAHGRDPWRQGVWVMTVYRFGRWRYGIRPAWLRRPFSLVYKFLKVGSQILTGIDLPCEARVGRRLRFDHFGGIVVSGDAVIGDDVVIRNGVTIGLRHTDSPGAPVIGNRVDIGAGAKILGSIRIGDDAVIGANAVVIRDVPAGATAVGIPARILARRTAPPSGGRLGARLLQPVAVAVDRDDLPARLGMDPELAANAAHVRVHRPRVDLRVQAPDDLEQVHS